MAVGSTKVLFIVGFARSGTTLIGNLLGEYEGVTHAGEVRMLWKRDLAQAGPPCGCGEVVPVCNWWNEVLRDWASQSALLPSQIGGGSDPPSGGLVSGSNLREVGRAMAIMQRSVERGFWRLRWRPEDHRNLVSEYATTHARLYGAISRTAASSVVVDSSKRPVHAAILHSAAGVDPYLVHVVRDPRGVVYSRQRKGEKTKADGSRTNRTQAGWDAVKWLHRNLVAERVMKMYGPGRSMFLRYEDFTSDPKGAIESILSMLGEPSEGSPFVAPAAAMLGPNHVSGGNRNRFVRGRIEINQDLRWADGLSPLDQAVVRVLAGVGLNRYGYGKSFDNKVMSAPPGHQG